MHAGLTACFDANDVEVDRGVLVAGNGFVRESHERID